MVYYTTTFRKNHYIFTRKLYFTEFSYMFRKIMYAEVYAGKVGFMLGIGAWRDAGAASG